MRALAKLIMQGRVQAIGTIVSLALMSLLLSPLVILTTAGISLVTLVQGYREGLLSLIAASVVITVFTALSLGQADVGLELAIKFWLPAWILASLVLFKASISLAIVIAAGISCVLVLGFYFFSSPATEWYELIIKQLLPMLKEAGVPIQEDEQAEKLWRFLSKIMTGTALAIFFIVQTMSLLLARWWQAVLYNPGKFEQEFHQLRFGVVTSNVVLVISIIAITSANEMVVNLIFIVIALMLFQGLAVVHRLVAKCKLSSAWLVGLYIIMIFTLQQGAIGVLLVALIGLLDNWLNFRFRLCADKAQNDMS